MKAKWLIELDLFPDTEEKLITTIKNSGRQVNTLQYMPTDAALVQKCINKYITNDCVVFYGSLEFGRKLRNTSWIPGVYLDAEKYKCTSYYPIYGDYLIHKNYLMMPFGDLKRRKSELFKLFGDKIFIRPNSGLKQFTGNVLTYDTFDEGIKLAGFYCVEPSLLVLVSDVADLLYEYRFVVVNQKIVSGSLYRDWSAGTKLEDGITTSDFIIKNSHSKEELCVDSNVYDFAQKMAQLYNPEAAWTMDIAVYINDGEYNLSCGLLEIGCFSCAGMYGGDLEAIVSAVSKAAEDEWNEYNNI